MWEVFRSMNKNTYKTRIGVFARANTGYIPKGLQAGHFVAPGIMSAVSQNFG